MKKRVEALLGLLFVPRCAACGVRLSPGTGALCADCLAGYRHAKEENCPHCGAMLSSCTCSSEFLGEQGIRRLIKLVRYYPHDAEAVQNRMLYSLKHRAPRALIDFLADELAEALLPVIGKGEKRVVLSYAPRSRRAARRHGFDHMALLGRAVALRLSVEWAPLLARHDGKEQKKRGSRAARIANMRSAYRYLGGPRELAGCKVILLDDVSASGATLAAAARALRRGGARGIVGCVFGYSFAR